MALEERRASKGGVAVAGVPVTPALCTGFVHYSGKKRPCRGKPAPGGTRCHKHLEPTFARVNADDLYFLLYHALCGIEETTLSSGSRSLERVHALIAAYGTYLPPERLPSLAPGRIAVTDAQLASKEKIDDPLDFFLDSARGREYT